MYVPKHFELPSEYLPKLLPQIQSGNLITVVGALPVATYLPIHFRDLDSDKPKLVSHISRVNPQWQNPPRQALFIADLANHYIDPSWSPIFSQKPRVPTWNYLTIHFYGVLRIHQDLDWISQCVAELSQQHNFDYRSVPMAAKLLRAIVGIELEITEILPKAKLSQNHWPVELAGEITELKASDGADIAQLMTEISCPYAEKRLDTVSTIVSEKAKSKEIR